MAISTDQVRPSSQPASNRAGRAPTTVLCVIATLGGIFALQNWSVAADAGNAAGPLNTEFVSFLRAATGQNDAQATPLESILSIAMSSHPQIAAARHKVAAAAQRVPQAAALPDPMLSNTFWPIHDQALQTAGGRVGHQMALSQQVPWPSKRTARTAVAAREIDVARAELAKVELEIITAIKLAYYQCWLTDKAISILKDNQELVSDLIQVSQARYKTGGSQQDVLRAEAEHDKLEARLIELRKQRTRAHANLGVLIQQPIDFTPTIAADLGVNQVHAQLESLIASAEYCNPTLRGLSAEVARDRQKENLACQQKYPDMQLGIAWSLIDDNTNVISPVANGHDNINFTFGVTLPIWRDKINAGIREAAHTRSDSQYRVQAERDRLRGQLRRQLADAFAAAEQKKLFDERLVPRTQQILKIATADYQGKKADFTDLIDIYQELLGYQIQVATIEATLASTIAQVERSVGCTVTP
ncbi:MAG: TolC family protein [Pirellulaceae bacterium]|nr:TolC family protein [Pirellulaceae bacterium]